MIMKNNLNRFITITSLLFLLLACSNNEQINKSVTPVAFKDSDICHTCGMMVVAYPGPKGQVFEQGNSQILKFCSTSDMMIWYMGHENQNPVLKMYVHDMAKSPWHKPDDKHLIPAKEAYYVIGSSKNGSMGPTLATFSDSKVAEGFAGEYGGRVLSFQKLTEVLRSTADQEAL